jgi:hypothetical protein
VQNKFQYSSSQNMNASEICNKPKFSDLKN